MMYERYTPCVEVEVKSRFDHDFKIDDFNFEIDSYNFLKLTFYYF